MRFTPLSEEELQTASLVPKGVYSYRVKQSEDKISKAGNEYTAITLKVWDDEGKEHAVFANMALIKLLKHFCDVNGLQEEYKSGDLPPSIFMNKSGGKVVIDIEGEKQNPNGGVYKAKNIVVDYVLVTPSSTMPLDDHSKKDEFINDEIPF